MFDGEIMADVAVSPELRRADYPFSTLAEEANVLVFPSQEAATIAYKLLQHLGGAAAAGSEISRAVAAPEPPEVAPFDAGATISSKPPAGDVGRRAAGAVAAHPAARSGPRRLAVGWPVIRLVRHRTAALLTSM
jgi:hypothetical protein